MGSRAGEAITDLTVLRSGYVAKERKLEDPMNSKIACGSGISRKRMPLVSVLATMLLR